MDDIPPGPGHETTDIGARSVAWFGMWLAGALALVLIAVAWMDKSLNHASAVWPRQPMQARPQFEPPGPPLQSSPVEDLHAHAAAEDALLHSYGWVDRKQSVVRIPIERAMELILARGLPVTAGTMPLPGPQNKGLKEGGAP